MQNFLRIVFIILLFLCVSGPLFPQTIFVNFKEKFTPMLPENLGQLDTVRLSPPILKEITQPYLRILAMSDAELSQAYIKIKKSKRALRINYQRNTVYTRDNPRQLFKTMYNPPKIDEKQMIRQAWAKAFGFDVWMPYYKYREIEDWVKERMSFKIFSLKCKPKFQKDTAVYICKSCF